MAGTRRAQEIDQWRPEELSVRERERDHPRERIIDTRAASPAPRAVRDDRRRSTHDADNQPSARHARGRSRERSSSRDRARRRSRGDSREDDRYRPSRARAPSSDRVSLSQRHHHRHRRDTSASAKRHRSRSPSPRRESYKRVKRHRTRSSERSLSRNRRPGSSHRPRDRAYSPRPPRPDRDRAARRPTPKSHIPSSASRHRSRSAESHYRAVSHRGHKRSTSPDSKSWRDEAPRHSSPKRHHRRHRTPSAGDRERGHHKYSSTHKDRSRSRVRHARSRSPRRRRSSTPVRRQSPQRTRRERASPRRSRSPREAVRRPSRSRSPHRTTLSRRSGKDAGTDKASRENRTKSRRGSPTPGSGYNSDGQRSKDGDAKMRGAYQPQGRGYSHSPPYMTPNQFSPQGQSPYGPSRGGWSGQHQPYPNQGSPPMQGFSPNQSPFQQNNHNYSPGHQGQYYSNQQYQGPPHQMQGGSQNSSYRGGHGGGIRGGNNFNGADRRMSGPSPQTGYQPMPSQRGRGVGQTQFSNLSWTPNTGTRGGRPATEAPRHSGSQAPPLASAEASTSAVDADDNPFRPSKDLRVEDEGPKEEKKMPPPTKPAAASTQPKGFSFSLKTKHPVPTATAQTDVPEPTPKESILDPKPRVASTRDTTSRYPSDSRSDRERERDRDRDREWDRDRERERERDYRERDRRYDPYDKYAGYYDRRPDYRDPRDARDPRDSRDLRDPRDSTYYRDREYRDPRDIRDPRDVRDTRDVRDPRDLRDPRDIRDPRDPRDLRDPRDTRDPRDPRDMRDPRDRDRREAYPSSRRPESRPESRPDSRTERREPPPDVPKTKIVKKKRIKPRPILTPEFAASDSVYYRKPGNESVVGAGTFGKVFKGVHVYTKDMVALKKIRMEGERDGFPITAIREIKLLQSLKHDSIVKLQEVMVEKNDCFMVFEYLSHDLTGLLNHPTFKLDDAMKKDLAKQLFEGLDYLHRRGVLHRDIKAANILVSNTGQLKLADFGLARFYAKRGKLDYTNRVITIWYRSPELLLGETQYGPAVDIWSAACVLVEIFTRHAIFPGDGGEINQLEKIYNVLGTPTVQEWPGIVDMQWFELLRPTERKVSTFADKYKDRVTPAAFELLSAMFLFDPAARPGASDVLEHPYFVTEAPVPKRAEALKELEGDWHEFESKALRKEKEKQDKEARRAAREGEKRRAESAAEPEREAKRVRSADTRQGQG